VGGWGSHRGGMGRHRLRLSMRLAANVPPPPHPPTHTPHHHYNHQIGSPFPLTWGPSLRCPVPAPPPLSRAGPPAPASSPPQAHPPAPPASPPLPRLHRPCSTAQARLPPPHRPPLPLSPPRAASDRRLPQRRALSPLLRCRPQQRPPGRPGWASGPPPAPSPPLALLWRSRWPRPAAATAAPAGRR
jgi:hypothetical protein